MLASVLLRRDVLPTFEYKFPKSPILDKAVSEILNIEVERESFLSKIKVSPNPVTVADHAALEKTFIEHYCTRPI